MLRGPLVECFLGLPGAGKTYAMTYYAVKVRKRFPDLPVWANYWVDLPGAPVQWLESVDQFEDAAGGLILLDEAHILLGSRDWTGTDRKRVLAKLGQMRKARLTLWFTTHSAGKVDKQLRLLTEQARHMSSLRRFGLFMYRMRAGVEPTAGSLGLGFVPMRKSVARRYDTLGAVGVQGFAAAAASTSSEAPVVGGEPGAPAPARQVLDAAGPFDRIQELHPALDAPSESTLATGEANRSGGASPFLQSLLGSSQPQQRAD